MLANWKKLLDISIVLIPLGNNLIYFGLQDTTALNGGLIPVARPVLILTLSWFRSTTPLPAINGVALPSP